MAANVSRTRREHGISNVEDRQPELDVDSGATTEINISELFLVARIYFVHTCPLLTLPSWIRLKEAAWRQQVVSSITEVSSTNAVQLMLSPRLVETVRCRKERF